MKWYRFALIIVVRQLRREIRRASKGDRISHKLQRRIVQKASIDLIDKRLFAAETAMIARTGVASLLYERLRQRDTARRLLLRRSTLCLE